MLKSLTIFAASLALSVQAASASPFGASVSAGASDRSAQSEERQGVFSYLMSRVAVAIVGNAGQSADGAHSFFFKTGECERVETVEGEEEEEEAKGAEPLGPEPIYYGF